VDVVEVEGYSCFASVPKEKAKNEKKHQLAISCNTHIKEGTTKNSRINSGCGCGCGCGRWKLGGGG
jgi:hypothetical protein